MIETQVWYEKERKRKKYMYMIKEWVLELLVG